MKTLVLATVLLAAPSLVMAMGCSGAKHQQAQSCASGTVYDAEKGTCVPSANS
jgi:hypothetical protein